MSKGTFFKENILKLGLKSRITSGCEAYVQPFEQDITCCAWCFEMKTLEECVPSPANNGCHGDPSRFASVVVTVRRIRREIEPYVVCNHMMNKRVARIVSIGSIRAHVSLLWKQNLYLLVNPNNYLHLYLSILLQWFLTQQLKNFRWVLLCTDYPSTCSR